MRDTVAATTSAVRRYDRRVLSELVQRIQRGELVLLDALEIQAHGADWWRASDDPWALTETLVLLGDYRQVCNTNDKACHPDNRVIYIEIGGSARWLVAPIPRAGADPEPIARVSAAEAADRIRSLCGGVAPDWGRLIECGIEEARRRARRTL